MAENTNAMIDRITPTLEPDQPVLLHQKWHHLAFLHWQVPAMELQQLIPPRLTVDAFDGLAYIGLVPFTITGVRAVLTPPLPLISSFHEINVRTYVHLDGRDPGVWFFSLDASSALAVAAARAAYKLAYYNADIDFTASDEPLPRIDFHSRRTDNPKPANARIRYRPLEGPSGPASPGTLEHFLVERYILYAEDDERQLYRARVHHRPYEVHRAEVPLLEETLIWAAGVKRPDVVELRHYSPGVDVKVYPLQKV